MVSAAGRPAVSHLVTCGLEAPPTRTGEPRGDTETFWNAAPRRATTKIPITNETTPERALRSEMELYKYSVESSSESLLPHIAKQNRSRLVKTVAMSRRGSSRRGSYTPLSRTGHSSNLHKTGKKIWGNFVKGQYSMLGIIPHVMMFEPISFTYNDSTYRNWKNSLQVACHKAAETQSAYILML